MNCIEKNQRLPFSYVNLARLDIYASITAKSLDYKPRKSLVIEFFSLSLLGHHNASIHFQRSTGHESSICTSQKCP